MSLLLSLPPELEERLRQEAVRRGQSVDVCAVETLDQHLPRLGRTSQLQALFAQWAVEDQAVEDSAAGYDFFQALDAARTSDRKLFPEELKGVTW